MKYEINTIRFGAESFKDRLEYHLNEGWKVLGLWPDKIGPFITAVLSRPVKPEGKMTREAEEAFQEWLEVEHWKSDLAVNHKEELKLAWDSAIQWKETQG